MATTPQKPTAVRWTVVLGAAWVVASAVLTVLLAPDLGLRGWVWLALHHLVLVGALGAEWWRKRRKKRLAAS